MTLVGMSGRVGALAPARHARRVHLPKSFSPPGRGGLFSAVRSKTLKKKWSRAIERKGPCLYVCIDGSRRACGVGDCPCLVPTLGDLRETSGPRIDRIPLTRRPWRRRQYRDIKKLIFLTPSKCPIDLCGPVANRRILKQIHGASHQKQQNGSAGSS